jgi:alkanesulfonate monooxygenase SsuD/methylene tetrahydromethanopterin reductase-like flavin-dependent oxidoreductase (luciferase family)
LSASVSGTSASTTNTADCSTQDIEDQGPNVKFSNFLFPAAMDPHQDHRIVNEALREGQLCDELGMDMLWLAEHHFDGICAYVDPISFAAALAASTRQIHIGFAVAQMSLHHPIRMAEQIALIDNISRGRIVVGLGRGTAYNIYDYQGYGIDPTEAYERLVEAEEIMIKAWTTPDFEHKGKFWNLRLPLLRPRPYTKPHPFIIRACASEEAMLGMARAGRPFLMNIQSNEVTKRRMDLYRATMREAGFDEETVARNVENTWVWRNIFVAETDAEAERLALPAWQTQQEFRQAMRKRVYEEQGLLLKADAEPAARNQVQHSILCGSPDTVCEAIAEIDRIGVGGLILVFRLGPMPAEVAEESIRLFMRKVAPRFRDRSAFAA